ncbi:sugar ABC transporter permease [Bosea sp. BK604]|uniref:carbohydrate ABC transporter permease n=1 Tax=Bosea sp. BK604 TaxID=2512180 RepID=UPI00104D6B4E|nr:sugar ABC transporter permease [Bosea sp. BK604]TCR64011.1 sorbitol ABC transporter membrane protein /mannitol ABC transporter membrane protein [Bosea sp. BK604]
MNVSASARRQRRNALFFLAPAACVLILIYLGPMLFALRASFTAWIFTSPGSENIYVGLENYSDVLTSPELWSAVQVTLIYAFASICCGLTLGTIFALLLDTQFYARSFFRSIMIIPMVITPSVIGIFWKLLYEEDSGVFNTALRGLGLPGFSWLDLAMALPSIILMDVWQTTPFFMLVILAGLQALDRNTVDAAKVDGATALQLFRYITLPHLVPYMLIATSFRAIAAMGDFDKIWLLTGGGPGDKTTTITIFAYKTGFSAFDIGRTTTIACIFVVIVLVASSPLLIRLFRSALEDRG